jgi:hypothetical protein
MAVAAAVAVMKEDGAQPRPKSSCAVGLVAVVAAAAVMEEDGA